MPLNSRGEGQLSYTISCRPSGTLPPSQKKIFFTASYTGIRPWASLNNSLKVTATTLASALKICSTKYTADKVCSNHNAAGR